MDLKNQILVFVNPATGEITHNEKLWNQLSAPLQKFLSSCEASNLIDSQEGEEEKSIIDSCAISEFIDCSSFESIIEGLSLLKQIFSFMASATVDQLESARIMKSELSNENNIISSFPTILLSVMMKDEEPILSSSGSDPNKPEYTDKDLKSVVRDMNKLQKKIRRRARLYNILKNFSEELRIKL